MVNSPFPTPDSIENQNSKFKNPESDSDSALADSTPAPSPTSSQTLSETLSQTLSKSSTHSASESSIENQKSKFKNPEWKPRRCRGPQSKIAQLSSELRALVNQLLDQEKTYEEIVEEMAKHGVSLNTDNVSKWFNGPYQDYLAALDWQDELQQLRDHAFSFGEGEGNVRFQEGLVQIGLTQLFRTIKEERLKDDPANSLRLFNSLARLSREALVIRKYADQQAKEKTAQLTRLDPNRQISEAEEMAMQDRADDFFGWKSAARLKHDLDSVTTERDTSVGATPVGSRDTSESAFVNGLGPETERTGFSPSPLQQEERAGERILRSNSHFEPLNRAVFSLSPSEGERVGERGPFSRVSPTRFVERRPAHDDALLDEQPTASEVPKNLTAASPAAIGPESGVEIQNSKISSDASPQSKIKIHQNSKIKNEFCPHCKAPLPPRLPNGIRRDLNCDKCSAPLEPQPMVGVQPVEHCPACHALLPPLLPDGQRPSAICACRKPLPPPGMAIEQKAEHCCECGSRLPAVLSSGERPSPNCPTCNASLPPPSAPETWVSEYCPACGVWHPGSTRTRQKPTEGCRICGYALPLIVRDEVTSL